jgi:fructoselysine 6-kinase
VPAVDFGIVGDNCIDRFVAPIDEWLVGGNAVNVAVQLALLGRSVEYFGAVGDDEAGRAVGAALAANGVGIAHLRVLPGLPTAYTDVEVTEDGDRSFVFEEFGACATYRPGPPEIAALRGMRHVHIGWLNDGGALKRALAGTGVSLSQDLSVNNSPDNLSAAGLDIAFRSAEPHDAEAVAGALLAEGARLAVVTMGAAGGLATDGKVSLSVSAAPITAEDTTGAGDAFIAGFLDAYVARAGLEECLRRGAERGALACLYRGGFPQQPLRRPPAPDDAQADDSPSPGPDFFA